MRVSQFTNEASDTAIEFYDMTIMNGDATGGGAVYLDTTSASSTWININFIGNSGTYGGALYINAEHHYFENCVFTDNSAYSGAVLYGADKTNCDEQSVSVVKCLFENNTATDGVLNFNLGVYYIDQSLVHRNVGSAIVNYEGTITLTESLVSDNSGYGLYMDGGELHLDGSAVSGNGDIGIECELSIMSWANSVACDNGGGNINCFLCEATSGMCDISDSCPTQCESHAFCPEIEFQFTYAYEWDACDDISLCDDDPDECSNGTHNCNANAECTNTFGSFECSCRSGYSGDGFNCTALVDECSTGTHDCAVNAVCTDTETGYECECELGFTGDDAASCEWACDTSDFDSFSPGDCTFCVPVTSTSAQSDIQTYISAASVGDTVCLGRGSYGGFPDADGLVGMDGKTLRGSGPYNSLLVLLGSRLIYTVSEANVTLRDVGVLSAGTSTELGGVVFADTTSLVTITNIRAIDAVGSSNGAVYAVDSRLVVTDSEFEGNRGTTGSSIYEKDGSAVIRRCTFMSPLVDSSTRAAVWISHNEARGTHSVLEDLYFRDMTAKASNHESGLYIRQKCDSLTVRNILLENVFGYAVEFNQAYSSVVVDNVIVANITTSAAFQSSVSDVALSNVVLCGGTGSDPVCSGDYDYTNQVCDFSFFTTCSAGCTNGTSANNSACVLPAMAHLVTTDLLDTCSVCTVDGDCGSDGTCAVFAECVEGSSCQCVSGYSGVGNVSCSDVDECAVGTHGCPDWDTCVNTAGSFECTNVDECSLGTHNCDEHATCTDLTGSFTCECSSGYVGDGTACSHSCDSGDWPAECDVCMAATSSASSTLAGALFSNMTTCLGPGTFTGFSASDYIDVPENVVIVGSGEASTVLDLQRGSGFYYEASYGSFSVSDLTMKRGYGYLGADLAAEGAGVAVVGSSSVTLQRVTFAYFQTHSDLVACRLCQAVLVEDCTFRDIDAVFSAALLIKATDVTLSRTTFTGIQSDSTVVEVVMGSVETSSVAVDNVYFFDVSAEYKGSLWIVGSSFSDESTDVTVRDAFFEDVYGAAFGFYDVTVGSLVNVGIYNLYADNFGRSERSVFTVERMLVCGGSPGTVLCDCGSCGNQDNNELCNVTASPSCSVGCADSGFCLDPQFGSGPNNITASCDPCPVDMCLNGSHNCDPNAVCTDQFGTFSCDCNDGYFGNGVEGNCTLLVDECSTGAHNCGVNATCTDTPYSFSCECGHGYSGDPTVACEWNCDSAAFRTFGPDDCTYCVPVTATDAQSSIQTMISGAAASDTICLGAGSYRGFPDEAGLVDMDNKTLRGAGTYTTLLYLNESRLLYTAAESSVGLRDLAVFDAGHIDRNGAVVYSTTTSVVTITNVRIVDAVGKGAGAIYARNTNLVVSDSEFVGNRGATASSIYLLDGGADIRRCSFIAPVVDSGTRSAVWVSAVHYSSGVHSVLEDLYFRDMTAKAAIEDAALYVRQRYDSISITNVLIENVYGYAVEFDDAYTTVAVDNLIVTNITQSAALQSSNSKVTMTNVVLCGGNGTDPVCTDDYAANEVCDQVFHAECSDSCDGSSACVVPTMAHLVVTDLLDDCSCIESPCGPGEECVVYAECSSTTCRCVSGYTGAGNTACSDVDECSTGSHTCPDWDACVNTAGSFTCVDADECTSGAHNCYSGDSCTNTVGSFSCADCPTGYVGDGATCSDADECLGGAHTCDASETCVNTIGSFACVDRDECSTGGHNCFDGVNCTNTVGSFSCADCPLGFTGDGVVCNDTDECVAGTHDCGGSLACANTVGSFACVLPPTTSSTSSSTTTSLSSSASSSTSPMLPSSASSTSSTSTTAPSSGASTSSVATSTATSTPATTTPPTTAPSATTATPTSSTVTPTASTATPTTATVATGSSEGGSTSAPASSSAATKSSSANNEESTSAVSSTSASVSARPTESSQSSTSPSTTTSGDLEVGGGGGGALQATGSSVAGVTPVERAAFLSVLSVLFVVLVITLVLLYLKRSSSSVSATDKSSDSSDGGDGSDGSDAGMLSSAPGRGASEGSGDDRCGPTGGFDSVAVSGSTSGVGSGPGGQSDAREEDVGSGSDSASASGGGSGTGGDGGSESSAAVGSLSVRSTASFD